MTKKILQQQTLTIVHDQKKWQWQISNVNWHLGLLYNHAGNQDVLWKYGNEIQCGDLFKT